MRTPIAGLLTLLLLGVGGCALLDGKDQLGTIIASWSQADDMKIDEIAPEGTVVLADAAARDRFLNQIADERGHDESPVAAVDMDDHFLVLGSYSKCMEESRVWTDTERTAVWFEVHVPRERRNTACAWSPVTIDFWRLPRSEFEQTRVEDLGTDEPS